MIKKLFILLFSTMLYLSALAMNTDETKPNQPLSIKLSPFTCIPTKTQPPYDQDGIQPPPFTLQDFEDIPLVGFLSPEHLKGLCLVQYALETYQAPQGNSQGLIFQQKNLLQLLSCIPKKTYNFLPQTKLLSLLVTLKKRANENFISQHCNVTNAYDTMIKYFQTNLEESLTLIDYPHAKAKECADLGLIESCNNLSEKLERHYSINNHINYFQRFAIEKIDAIMLQLEKNQKNNFFKK